MKFTILAENEGDSNTPLIVFEIERCYFYGHSGLSRSSFRQPGGPCRRLVADPRPQLGLL